MLRKRKGKKKDNEAQISSTELLNFINTWKHPSNVPLVGEESGFIFSTVNRESVFDRKLKIRLRLIQNSVGGVQYENGTRLKALVPRSKFEIQIGLLCPGCILRITIIKIFARKSML